MSFQAYNNDQLRVVLYYGGTFSIHLSDVWQRMIFQVEGHGGLESCITSDVLNEVICYSNHLLSLIRLGAVENGAVAWQFPTLVTLTIWMPKVLVEVSSSLLFNTRLEKGMNCSTSYESLRAGNLTILYLQQSLWYMHLGKSDSTQYYTCLQNLQVPSSFQRTTSTLGPALKIYS